MTSTISDPVRPAPSPSDPVPVARRSLGPTVVRVLTGLVIAAAVVGGIVLRFISTSPLWLDEAQSAAIARLPLPGLFDALRADGSPPLYYLLLHGWIGLVGNGDSAVRALSGLMSVATLPPLWLLAERIWGRRSAWAVLVVAASTPFLVRYASETRMYALLVLLSALGGLALERLLRRPAVLPAAALALVSGLLLLTHYWALFLLAVLGAGMLVRARRGPQARAYRWAAVALASGGLLLVPWLPSMAFQLAHTGTPWAAGSHAIDVVNTLFQWAGLSTRNAPLMGLILLGLAAIAAVARPLGDGRLLLELRGSSVARDLIALAVGTLVLAVLVSLLGGGAYVARYTSVAVVPFLLCVGVGVALLPSARTRLVVLAVITALGLTGSADLANNQRTQAGPIAAALAKQAKAGDLVLYCPDQLGPAVSRRLAQIGAPELTQQVYPTGGSPQRVNWVDYASRNQQALPAVFAARADRAAGSAHAIWLVASPGYRTFGDSCGEIAVTLTALRGTPHYSIRLRTSYDERADLIRF